MVDGGERRYLDRLSEEPSVRTRYVLAYRWQHQNILWDIASTEEYPDITVARRENVGWGNSEYYLYNVYNSTEIEK
jgi:hypothetical protein